MTMIKHEYIKTDDLSQVETILFPDLFPTDYTKEEKDGSWDYKYETTENSIITQSGWFTQFLAHYTLQIPKRYAIYEQNFDMLFCQITCRMKSGISLEFPFGFHRTSSPVSPWILATGSIAEADYIYIFSKR